MIDIDLQTGLTYIETYGVHHIAKALREMEKVIAKADVLKKGNLNVTMETREQ